MKGNRMKHYLKEIKDEEVEFAYIIKFKEKENRMTDWKNRMPEWEKKIRNEFCKDTCDEACREGCDEIEKMVEIVKREIKVMLKKVAEDLGYELEENQEFRWALEERGIE